MPWNLKHALILFGAAWVVVPAIFYLGIQLLAVAIPSLSWLPGLMLSDDPIAIITISVIDAIASIFVIGYILRHKKASWSDLGFRKFNPLKAALYIIGLFILFILAIQLVFILVQLLVPSFNPDEAQTNEFAGAPNLHIAALFVMVILPAVIEETVFRGFVFPAFAKRFGIVGGAIFSSLLFGLAHFQPNIVVYTFVVGLVLCFLYVRLGSTIPGIALHMLNNYIAFLALTQS